jgi:hypothetical protein
MTSIIKKQLFGITNLSLLMAKIKGDDKIAKTDDRLELNSLWGKSRRLLFSLFFNFKTQMDAGLDKDDLKISQLFSPLFSIWTWMLWKKK